MPYHPPNGLGPFGGQKSRADCAAGKWAHRRMRSDVHEPLVMAREAAERDPAAESLRYRSVGSVWTPLGLDESIRTLGPIVEETASDLM
jgi:hypothetical protein